MKTPWLVVCWMLWVALAVANPGGSDDSGLGKLSSSEQFSAEAVQTCNGLQDGTGCRFAGQEQLDGVCRSGSRGEPTVCVPSDPASPIGDLSPEAIRVCNGIPQGTESTDPSRRSASSVRRRVYLQPRWMFVSVLVGLGVGCVVAWVQWQNNARQRSDIRPADAALLELRPLAQAARRVMMQGATLAIGNSDRDR